MKPTDIIKIKRIISNNNITAKELELSDSDFLAYKEAARIVKALINTLGNKIYECDVVDLFITSNLMRAHTGTDTIIPEFIERYFNMRDKKLTTKSLNEFLVEMGCGANSEVKHWNYPHLLSNFSSLESYYLAQSNQESVNAFHALLPEDDKHIFIKAFMKRFPYGLPAHRSMRYYCKYFIALSSAPEIPKYEFKYTPFATIEEQVKWCQFFKVNKDIVMSWMDNSQFQDIEKILIENVNPENTKIGVFFRLLEMLDVEQRCFVVRLSKREELYNTFLSRFKLMVEVGKEKEYVNDLMTYFTNIAEITTENLKWHFVDFAYPKKDNDYIKIFGCSKLEFAVKFPFRNVLTQVLLDMIFETKNAIKASQYTNDCVEKLYYFFIEDLSKNVYYRRKFCELGAAKILEILDKHKASYKSDDWSKAVIEGLASEPIDTIQPNAW